MATPISKYKISFPVFTKTVVDKNGLRVEWTDAGKDLLEQVVRQSPLSHLLFQDITQTRTKKEIHFMEFTNRSRFISPEGVFDNGLIGMDLGDLTSKMEELNFLEPPILPTSADIKNSPWFVPMTFTSNSTTMVTTPIRDTRTLEDFRQLENELLEEIGDLSDEIQELEDTMERIDAVLENADFTRSDMFLLEQRRRMKEKGWTLAFLSPSVVELLEAKSIADYTEEGVPFFYAAGNPDVE